MTKQVNTNHQEPFRYDEPGAAILRDTFLEAEELEPVIAPQLAANHNETILDAAELEAEELEPVIAPGMRLQNHNEAFLAAAELEAEELEPVIAPQLAANHNETFLS
jgi:hypothetical protein